MKKYITNGAGFIGDKRAQMRLAMAHYVVGFERNMPEFGFNECSEFVQGDLQKQITKRSKKQLSGFLTISCS